MSRGSNRRNEGHDEPLRAEARAVCGRRLGCDPVPGDGDGMKAITLMQPWASLVASGDKRIETRRWNTNYRGPLAIHASKAIPDWVEEWMEENPAVQTMLFRAGHIVGSPLPLGCVVATCQLVGVRSTDHIETSQLGKARILGNFTPGRFA